LTRAAGLFVTNVLNKTVPAGGKVVHRGTVVRIVLSVPRSGAPRVLSNRVIARVFAEHTDPNALVIGPTGVGLGRGGTLFVADSASNRIAAVPHALTRSSALGGGGRTVARGGRLNAPLGLLVAPGGDIATTNGGDGRIVETAARVASSRPGCSWPMVAEICSGSRLNRIIEGCISLMTLGPARPPIRFAFCADVRGRRGFPKLSRGARQRLTC
jgi:hypothetical protein